LYFVIISSRYGNTKAVVVILVNLVAEKWQSNLLVKEKGSLEAYFYRPFWIVMNGRFYYEFLEKT